MHSQQRLKYFLKSMELNFRETIDMEFVGYVIKFGNYYFGGRTQNSISVVKKSQNAEIYNEDELDIAERVASDLGGTIRKIYVSDKE